MAWSNDCAMVVNYSYFLFCSLYTHVNLYITCIEFLLTWMEQSACVCVTNVAVVLSCSRSRSIRRRCSIEIQMWITFRIKPHINWDFSFDKLMIHTRMNCGPAYAIGMYVIFIYWPKLCLFFIDGTISNLEYCKYKIAEFRFVVLRKIWTSLTFNWRWKCRTRFH